MVGRRLADGGDALPGLQPSLLQEVQIVLHDRVGPRHAVVRHWVSPCQGWHSLARTLLNCPLSHHVILGQFAGNKGR